MIFIPLQIAAGVAASASESQSAQLIDDGPRRVVLPTILRGGDLFEGGAGGLIHPTIGPGGEQRGTPDAGFISPEFLPR